MLSEAVRYLGIIASEAYKYKETFKDSYKATLGFIQILGAYSKKYCPEATDDIVWELKNLCKDIKRNDFESDFASVLQDVKEYLDPYKECNEYLGKFEALQNYDYTTSRRVIPIEVAK